MEALKSEQPQSIEPWRREREDWLDEIGVHWVRFPALALTAIDKQRSLANQARVDEPLQEDQVLIYATSMDQGDVFPAIVAYRRKDKPLCIIADGNHTYAAAELIGRDSIPAYIVEDPSEAQVARLTLEADTRAGRGRTMRDRIHHALLLNERWGLSLVDACRQVRVPEKRVATYRRERDAERRLRALHLPVPNSRGNLKRIGSIKSDEVLVNWPLGSLSNADFNRLVTEVNRAR